LEKRGKEARRKEKRRRGCEDARGRGEEERRRGEDVIVTCGLAHPVRRALSHSVLIRSDLVPFLS